MLTLQACLNGARTRVDHPAVPTTPAAIATAAAAVAGLVDGVHVHAKGPDGTDSLVAAHVDATVAAIRAATPTLEVGVTTGAWASPDRGAAIRAWTVLPDVASVNWHEPGADDVAAALLDRGIGVEAGVWHADGLDAWLRSAHRDRVTRVLVEVQAMDADPAIESATALLAGVREASPAPILLHGEDASAWPVLRLAASLGLATRMGLEDALTLDDGTVAAGNLALVRRAAAVVGRG